MKEKPLVSIIVPTQNSSRTIDICLESIREQTYPNIEIIVIDNYSIDGTVETARKYGSIVFQVRALRSAARNYGAKKAGGTFLVFIDADQELTPEVIEECVQKAINDHADAIMIPEIRSGEGFWGKCRALERLTYIGDPLIESARFYRKEVFERVGEYDERLEAGEDRDLHAQVEDTGCRIVSIKAIMKHHEEHMMLKDLVRKRYHYGKTFMRYVRKHPERARVQFIPLRLNFLRNWRILAKQPLYACGMFLMKLVEYMATVIALSSSRKALFGQTDYNTSCTHYSLRIAHASE